MASVKVAVRVRPFNQREVELNAERIIEMNDNITSIFNNKLTQSVHEGELGRERKKDFSYDYSYWSFCGKDKKFVSQEKVFNDLGVDVIDNAFEGYNACVFAYGQTGSGKTFTMMGDETNVGLIPRICQDLFERMNNQRSGTTYKTEVCYLEIYNEKVKDLLRPNSDSTKLKIREHPQHGPYVEGLSQHSVMDYEDISSIIQKGNLNRTTASTNMNEASSRSHAILTITFVQATFSQDMPRETVSKINLVDLAGSERADTSGAQGQRLKEGAHINKSLVTLGLVISDLADMANIQNKRNIFIRYRDSVLTWLLKDSLGGNSKTIMIATISPADVNYGETLSTLRYAHRAKNIVNKPTINEDPNVKVIRELRAEISRLKSLLSTNKNGNSSLISVLHANEEKVKVLTDQWAERWRETKNILEEQKTLALRKSGYGVVLDSDQPHLVGIGDSADSTGMTFYPLKKGKTYIGGESTKPNPDINDIKGSPCMIFLATDGAVLHPSADILCSVDGNLIEKPTVLDHGCAINIGRNIFRYNDPSQAEKFRKQGRMSSTHLSRLAFLSRSTPNLDKCLNRSTEALDKGFSVQNLSKDQLSYLEACIIEQKRKAHNERNSSIGTVGNDDVINSPLLMHNNFKSMDQIAQTEDSPYSHAKNSTPRRHDLKLSLSSAFKRYSSQISNGASDSPISNFQADDGTLDEIYELKRIRLCLEQLDQDLRATPSSNDREKLQQVQILKEKFNALQERLYTRLGDTLSPITPRNCIFSPRYGSEFEYPPLSHKQLPDGANAAFSRVSCCAAESMSSASSQYSFCLDTDDVLRENDVSVIIPSFIARGSGNSVYYDYEIQMTVRHESWTIYRQHKRFGELHTYIQQKYGKDIIKGLRVPRNYHFFWKPLSENSLEKRRQQLEAYLHEVLARCLSTKECHLYAYADSLSRELLCDYLPFFRKGDFEGSKFTAG